jgi:hypothetical protein
LAERAIGFFVTIKEEVRDEQGKVIRPAVRQYYPPDPTSIIFFLKNRMKDKYRDVHNVDVNQRGFKSLEEAMATIRDFSSRAPEFKKMNPRGLVPVLVHQALPHAGDLPSWMP